LNVIARLSCALAVKVTIEMAIAVQMVRVLNFMSPPARRRLAASIERLK